MPTFTVTAPAGALDKAQRDALMRRLTDTLLKWEGAAPDNAAAQAIAWTYYNELPEGFFYVGGANPAAPRFKIEIGTPQGALNDKSRAGLVADIDAILAEVVGPAASGMNHWVLLGEIMEGGWGVAGRIFRHADIVAAVRGGATAPTA